MNMILRYLVPLLLVATAGFVWNYNETHTSSYMLLPLLDSIPSLRGDLEAQAAWSWKFIGGLGVLVLLFNLATTRRRTPPASEKDGR